jgi:hypothetical protein
MLQHIISKAVSVVFGLGAMTTAALAGPLGSAPPAETRSALTPAAFIWDGGVTLFPNIPNFAFFLRGGTWFDSNNVVWVPLYCCVTGQSSIGLAADGLFYEPSGVYGAPIVYDGGYNILLVPF